MTDLISRQAALDALEWKWAGKAAIDAIKNLPTIDPVKHGKWMCVDGKYYCSECDEEQDWKTYYCSGCGAKMDGGEDDGPV